MDKLEKAIAKARMLMESNVSDFFSKGKQQELANAVPKDADSTKVSKTHTMRHFKTSESERSFAVINNKTKLCDFQSNVKDYPAGNGKLKFPHSVQVGVGKAREHKGGWKHVVDAFNHGSMNTLVSSPPSFRSEHAGPMWGRVINHVVTENKHHAYFHDGNKLVKVHAGNVDDLIDRHNDEEGRFVISKTKLE